MISDQTLWDYYHIQYKEIYFKNRPSRRLEWFAFICSYIFSVQYLNRRANHKYDRIATLLKKPCEIPAYVRHDAKHKRLVVEKSATHKIGNSFLACFSITGSFYPLAKYKLLTSPCIAESVS